MHEQSYHIHAYLESVSNHRAATLGFFAYPMGGAR